MIEKKPSSVIFLFLLGMNRHLVASPGEDGEAYRQQVQRIILVVALQAFMGGRQSNRAYLLLSFWRPTLHSLECSTSSISIYVVWLWWLTLWFMTLTVAMCMLLLSFNVHMLYGYQLRYLCYYWASVCKLDKKNLFFIQCILRGIML